MIYTDFKGEKISQLGFGTMRLPVINGVDKDIDEEKALEMFDYAYKHGINYFDYRHKHVPLRCHRNQCVA